MAGQESTKGKARQTERLEALLLRGFRDLGTRFSKWARLDDDTRAELRVKVAATNEGVTITSDNPDLGEVREELEADYNGDAIAIGFNPKYVVELPSQMSSDQITISLGGELDPGLIRPLTGEDYLGVVMPMRI